MGSVNRFLRVQKEESSSEQADPVEGLVTSGLKPYEAQLPGNGHPRLGAPFSWESHWGPGDHFPLFESKILELVAAQLPS